MTWNTRVGQETPFSGGGGQRVSDRHIKVSSLFPSGLPKSTGVVNSMKTNIMHSLQITILSLLSLALALKHGCLAGCGCLKNYEVETEYGRLYLLFSA